ncbi:MAG: hypothetical protein OXG85_04110 [Chloroflexi bacterium]|nr:hypothetical protein [Chloroflexota bacterium]
MLSIVPVLLYAPVGVIVYWRLIPRLCPPGKRLANVMLAAQLLVTVLSLAIQPASVYEKWLWTFSSWNWNESEWNIPATLASTQLALVGGVALLTAWFTWRRSRLNGLYYVAVGLVFVYLALDEFFALHENLPNWSSYYILLGVAIAVATMLVAARSPRPAWLWCICLLVGLATSATGAMVFDVFPVACGNVALLPIEDCIYSSYIEESLEYIGIWLVLVAMLGLLCHSAPALPRRARRALYAMPALWIFLLLLNSLAPHLELPLTADTAEVQLESGVRLRGFHVDSKSGEALRLRLYASAMQADYLGLGYSLHLVDQATGESAAGQDEWANRQHSIWLFGPDYSPVYRQWMEVRITPSTPTNRALWIVLTLWRERDGAFVRQKILSSELPLLDDKQVILGELVLPAESPPAWSTPLASFDNGFALETVDMPERARAGEQLDIAFAWRSDAAGLADYSQFLHFVHAESDEWWGYDQSPLGPRLPTRLWYSGLADSETWHIPVPPDLTPGQYTVYTGLYRVSDLERLPVRNADGLPSIDARVRVGSIIVER